MAQIPLGQGRFAEVDDADFPWLSRSRWFYKGERDRRRGRAMRHGRNLQGGMTTEYLTRVIMNPPPGARVVHLNYDSLDCRRENLAVVDTVQAQRRKRVRKDSVSGIKGVRYDRDRRKWVATLWREGAGREVGVFRTARDADLAFKQAVLQWEEYEKARRRLTESARPFG